MPEIWSGAAFAARKWGWPASLPRVNDAVSLSAYASKSLVPRYRYPLRGGLPLYLPGGGDRIGAMAEFKVGKNAAVQISVEHCSDSFVPPAFGVGGMKPYGW